MRIPLMAALLLTFTLICTAAGPATNPSPPPATQPATRVDLKAMSLFPFDQEKGAINDIPKAFQQLDGRRVTFAAEMWAPKTQDDGSLTRFQAVYSKAKWSFRGPPRVQDFWDCKVPAGVKVSETDEPIQVTGVLHVAVHQQDGVITSIYAVDVESVGPIVAAGSATQPASR